MDTMFSVPALPDAPLAVRAVEYVRSCETDPVINHSIRSYLFAALLAEHEGLRAGADFDKDLLFFACVLHDLGTSPLASGTQRFEVDGADMAATFLAGNGIGAAIDFGVGSDFISAEQGRAIHDRYPRLNMATALIDEIVKHAARGRANAFPPSVAADCIRERKDGLTTLERVTRAGRWGE